MLKPLLTYIRDHDLVHSGHRVGIAVSGGADSVALLRAMVALREELGVLVSVIHVHHGIRGTEADTDAKFVSELAREHSLPLHLLRADVPAYAAEHALSLEAAGRAVRYAYFRQLLSGQLDRVATAHTRDDQAETVLLRLIRGAGTRGLAGVYPSAVVNGDAEVTDRFEGAPFKPPFGLSGVSAAESRIIRPLLGTSRVEVESYLHELDQSWREDASNADRIFLRNRVRHELLPLLEREFNPNIRQVLAQTAEVSRDEEDWWTRSVDDIRTLECSDGALMASPFIALHPALQRRVLRALAEEAGEPLGFEAIERARYSILSNSAGSWPISGKLNLEFTRQRDGSARFRFCQVAAVPTPATSYEYEISIPGEVDVQELGLRFYITSASLTGHALRLRNWRPGDRFHAKGRGSEKKLKELFQIYRIPSAERALLPILECNGEIVWVRGLPPSAKWESKAEEGVFVRVETIPFVVHGTSK